MNKVWIYIAIMVIVSWVLRILPITILRKQIKNNFIKSVLYYLPYVTLSVMIVPAIFYVSDANMMCGVAALICAILVSWFTSNLLLSAIVSCVAVFLVSML